MRRQLFATFCSHIRRLRQKALAGVLTLGGCLLATGVAFGQMGYGPMPPGAMAGPMGGAMSGPMPGGMGGPITPAQMGQAGAMGGPLAGPMGPQGTQNGPMGTQRINPIAMLNRGVMPVQGYAQLPPQGMQMGPQDFQLMQMQMQQMQTPPGGPGYACPPGAMPPTAPGMGYPSGPGYNTGPATPIMPGSDGGAPQQPTPQVGDMNNVPQDFDPGSNMDFGDLSGDGGGASAGQAAAPNMIGDSFGGSNCGVLTFDIGGLDTFVPLCPGGGRSYRAATNNNAIPQTRFFYNFSHFNDALTFSDDNGNQEILNANRHEIGFEYKLFSGLSSLQFVLPFSDSIDSTISQNFGTTLPANKDTEIGNISLIFKRVIYADPCRVVSMGFGGDFATASDVAISATGQDIDLFVENNAATFHSYLAWSIQPAGSFFTQGFLQCSVPLGENDFVVDSNVGGINAGEIDAIPLFIADVGVGAWLTQDACTGQGIAVMGEIHYTGSLEEDTQQILLANPAGVAFNQDRVDLLNFTGGITIAHRAWDATFGYSMPLLDGPNHEAFDWEVLANVNRRF